MMSQKVESFSVLKEPEHVDQAQPVGRIVRLDGVLEAHVNLSTE